MSLFLRFNRQNIFNRYQVNLLVDNSDKGAPWLKKNLILPNLWDD